MKGTLTQPDGRSIDTTLDVVRQHITAGSFFWVDLDGVDEEASQVLQEDFGFHPPLLAPLIPRSHPKGRLLAAHRPPFQP